MSQPFIEPEMELIPFEVRDIITTSSGESFDENELPPFVVG